MTRPDGFCVGVVVARLRIDGAWPSTEWRARAILPTVPTMPAGTILEETDAGTLFYAGSAFVALERGATPHYGDNLVAAVPSVWVVLRLEDDRVGILDVTVDPYAGEGYLEGLDTIVEAVPMPSDVAQRVRAYYDAFHVEAVFVKRERSNPSLDGFGRGRIDGREE